ncbi:MAG: hypothetical protein B0W54_19985 [Cellvibrio sp. 79]|nr:MAG: hypothetical protein B0W54_19985 [Cellvibrio sp. 79]
MPTDEVLLIAGDEDCGNEEDDFSDDWAFEEELELELLDTGDCGGVEDACVDDVDSTRTDEFVLCAGLVDGTAAPPPPPPPPQAIVNKGATNVIARVVFLIRL